jgi:hypothetical protein
VPRCVTTVSTPSNCSYSRVEYIVNTTDIYRRAIKRTFADLYGVAPDTVDVTWTGDSESIIVSCAGKRFAHQILSVSDGGAPEFFSDDDDPVIVTLTPVELRQLERLA